MGQPTWGEDQGRSNLTSRAAPRGKVDFFLQRQVPRMTRGRDGLCDVACFSCGKPTACWSKNWTYGSGANDKVEVRVNQSTSANVARQTILRQVAFSDEDARMFRAFDKQEGVE